MSAYGQSADGSAKVRGPLHLSTGQEAVPAGVCAHLRPADYLTSTHRGHGHTLAKGADLARMMAELFGKSTGFNGGKGGSMHIADFSVGMLGANGVVAAGLPIAVGAAHAQKIKGEDAITVCFFGDGAINRGPFLEALNWARVYNLPVLFVCEDNRWSATTASGPMTAGDGASARALSLDIPATQVDGNDVVAVHAAAAPLVAQVRAGHGPLLLHALTYRVKGHVSVDPAAYRDPQELADALLTDPIARLRQGPWPPVSTRSRAGRHRSRSRARRWRGPGRRQCRALARGQRRFHRRADHRSRHMVLSDSTAAETISYAEAAVRAVGDEMHGRPRVVVLGEDVGRGGIFGQYAGLQTEFGAQRVIDTPISEAAIMGAGVGMALAGLRPVVEMRVVDFALCGMDEIVNQAAKNRFMFGGQGRVPLVARMPGGIWDASAAQHSQSLEAWFAHLPGVVVVCPSTPQDNYSLLRAALQCGDPVIYIEHKTLWGSTGAVDETLDIPLGQAAVRRAGNALTMVSWSRQALLCAQACETLAAEGIDGRADRPAHHLALGPRASAASCAQDR